MMGDGRTGQGAQLLLLLEVLVVGVAQQREEQSGCAYRGRGTERRGGGVQAAAATTISMTGGKHGLLACAQPLLPAPGHLPPPDLIPAVPDQPIPAARIPDDPVPPGSHQLLRLVLLLLSTEENAMAARTP